VFQASKPLSALRLAVRLLTETERPMRRTVSNLILWSLLPAIFPFYASGQKEGPCPDGPNVSNAEMRECYTKAKVMTNMRADDLAARAAANLRGITPNQKALYGPVVVQCLEDAAKQLDASQLAWHTYRDQYCNAIASDYTTGSGAGTAMEECLYTIASARVRQLLLDFPESAGPKKHSH
jgi:lysozyme inhibitor LprI